MSKVKIVTDSTADIPKELAEELNITVVPLNVIFSEEETYEDGVTLTSQDFYQKLMVEETIPTTSQPTPFQFEEVYRSLAEQGETNIISIHLSSKLSGTFQAASIASQSFDEEISLHVVDSKLASYGIGIMVVEVARMAQQGKSLEECLQRLEELLQDTKLYFLVDTLEYLQKNGRIGKASALLGSLLKIKPILSINEDGEVYPFEKVRGQKKAINRIIDVLKEEYGDAPVHIGSPHAVNDSLANELLERARQEFNVQSEVRTNIGAVIGAHAGPGAVALVVTKAKS
ncbi:DegV family protein [Halalkalibacter urbisdiaboli]|uniref:DegV family protein n=1 Tax=Halalkalibacter urbisdiaboli TaxID=1960589 RepID=UPI000B44F3AB|nr:DegV family protein [Halalkalibacter urbisdiaboli]